MSDGDGLKALETIRRQNPDMAVLIFSASEDVKEMAVARKLGTGRLCFQGEVAKIC